MYKPNLIPNNPKDNSFSHREAMLSNGNIQDYCITVKKDGCRLVAGNADTVLSRSLKKPGSELVVSKFQYLNDICKKHNIILDGEFYKHGLKFNAIYRFFTKSNVEDPAYKIKLEKEYNKNPDKFEDTYDGLDIDYLTTFHEELSFWAFDGIILDRPDIVGYLDRMNEIKRRLKGYEKLGVIWPVFMIADSYEEVEKIYNNALELDFEGLVLTHKDHEYKYGRNSLKQGTLLKMKDDAQEFDGVVLDVMESTVVKDGVEKSVNELGRSVTSKKKDDRVPSGMAKTLLIQFEDLGTFEVGLKGFNHEERREMLENKDKYIGRHFKYKAMTPVKSFPRHAYFDCWRDEK